MFHGHRNLNEGRNLDERPNSRLHSHRNSFTDHVNEYSALRVARASILNPFVYIA